MPIDATIPLQVRAPQIQPFDPSQALMTFAQLRRLQQQAQLTDLQLQEAQDMRGERTRLRDLFSQYATAGSPAVPGTPGAPAGPAPPLMGQPLSSLSLPPGNYVEQAAEAPVLANPDQGRPPLGTPGTPATPRMSFQELDARGMAAAPTLWPALRTHYQDAEMKTLQVQKAKRDELASVVEYALRMAPLIDTLPGQDRQGAYTHLLESVNALGYPMQHAPQAYSPQAVQQIIQAALPIKDKLEFALKQQEMQLKTGKVNYGLGNDLDAAVYARYGAQLGPQGSPTSAMVEQAQQDVEARRLTRAKEIGSEAERIKVTLAPLPETAAKQVGDLNALLAMHADTTTLFKPEFTGQVAGRLGSVRQALGEITPEEVQFRRLVADMKDTLLRARSGAQINEQEYRRLSTLVPSVTDPPAVFQANLVGFGRMLDQVRTEKLRMATTPRATVQEQTPLPRPLATSPGQTMSQQDVLDAMQQTGKTREEVLAAAKARGFAVQGAP